jgi:hypothetical protein
VKSLTAEQLLRLQALAISEGNARLKVQTWIAQGYDPRYAFVEVLISEQRDAMAGCVGEWEMAVLTGAIK